MRLSDRSSRISGAGWLRLYPRAWRRRYETEMLAVLEARPVTNRVRFDLVRGALDAHLNPISPPSLGLVAPVVAGAAWIGAGGAALAEPTPPDWPGYLLWTLPFGLIGAVAGLRIVLVAGRRSGMRSPAGSGAALLVALVGHLAWIAVLALAIVGGRTARSPAQRNRSPPWGPSQSAWPAGGPAITRWPKRCSSPAGRCSCRPRRRGSRPALRGWRQRLRPGRASTCDPPEPPAALSRRRADPRDLARSSMPGRAVDRARWRSCLARAPARGSSALSCTPPWPASPLRRSR